MGQVDIVIVPGHEQIVGSQFDGGFILLAD